MPSENTKLPDGIFLFTTQAGGEAAANAAEVAVEKNMLYPKCVGAS